VGLVHFALARKGAATIHLERRYGDLGRVNVRHRSVEDALSLLEQAIR
jgi:nicotinamide-nucleotide amidase